MTITAQEARLEAIDIMLVEVYGYYRQELRDTEVLMWHRKLAGHSVEVIAAAFDIHTSRSGYCPRFSDILDVIAPRSKALLFEDLHHNVVRRGPYRAPVFDLPETREIVERLGGWQTVCEEMPLPSDRNAYDAYRKRVDALYDPAFIHHAMRERAVLTQAGALPAIETDQPHG
jgi:hypothetical protein